MGAPKPWTVEDADQAIRWFVHRALDGRLKKNLESQVQRAPNLAEDERIEQVLSLRAALPEEERVKLDQTVFEARHRRKHKPRRSVPIRAPTEAADTLRAYAKQHKITIMDAFRLAVEALEKQQPQNSRRITAKQL